MGIDLLARLRLTLADRHATAWPVGSFLPHLTVLYNTGTSIVEMLQRFWVSAGLNRVSSQASQQTAL